MRINPSLISNLVGAARSVNNPASRMMEIARRDFTVPERFASSNQTLAQIASAVKNAGEAIEAAAALMRSLEQGNTEQILKDTGELLLQASEFLNDIDALLNPDARQAFSEGSGQLRQASTEIINGAIEAALAQIFGAGQSVGRGIQASERESTVATPRMTPRFTGQLMRNELLRRLEADTSSAQPGGIKQKIDEFLERSVDNLLFDKIGLKRSYSGGGSRSAEAGRAWGSGMSVDDVRNYAMTGQTAYGVEGHTLAEGSLGWKVGEVDRSAQGRWGSAFVNGGTHVGVRGRVFGDASWEDLTAYIGAEAEVGARATYNAGYSTPRARIAGQDVGIDAGVTADVFAGAAARGKLGVSLKGGEPHVSVGGEAFAGARASIQGSAAANINGTQVASVHGKAEGWAGAGVKANLDVGFKDGKLNFDMGFGAALGIGGSVDWGFSVDVGAIGKGIAGGLGNVAMLALSGFDLDRTLAVTGRAAEQIGRNLANAFDKVDDKIEDVAKDAGRAVSRAADQIADKVEDAAKDVGKAVGNAAKDVGKFFKKIF